jgi:tetratricopeptide (TPR) repeat protein
MRRRGLIVLSMCMLGCSRPSPVDDSGERQADPSERQADASKAEPDNPAPAPAELSFNKDASAFTSALADIDTEAAAVRARAEAQPKGWIVLEKLANLYLRRARLSGSYDDYAAAQEALKQAFERAPEGAGPVLTRAALDFTLHRLDPIEADLAAYETILAMDGGTRAHIAGIRGDVAFQRGQYQQARELFDAALALDREPPLLSKLAHWHWSAGELDEAERLYLEALGLMPPTALESRAWVHLQLGLMDLGRGRYDDAFAHYRDGTQILGGWWLLEEHIAEIAALKGMDAYALELYDDIIERTGKGEFLDAKAGLLARAGDQAGAQAAIEQAAKVFEAELVRFPEASYGHALDHYLEFGPPERALELATANHQLRPGVPAMISLAQARLGMNDVAGAREIIDQALATTWVSAELSWVASQIYTRLGEADRAAQLRAEAEALHPGIAG